MTDLCALSVGDACPFFTQLAQMGLLGPLAILVAAVLAWRVQLAILRRRAAWDFIAQHEQSRRWISATNKAKIFLRSLKEDAALREFVDRWSERTLSKEQRAGAAALINWLNRKEFVAIAIRRRTMSRRLYASWWGIEYVEEWNQAADLIQAMINSPRGDALLYEYFEKVATSLRFLRHAKWPCDKEVKKLVRSAKPQPSLLRCLISRLRRASD